MHWLRVQCMFDVFNVDSKIISGKQVTKLKFSKDECAESRWTVKIRYRYFKGKIRSP